MDTAGARDFVDHVYRREYGAERAAVFASYFAGTSGAVLGYRRAEEEPLFLEAYLDRPIEDCLRLEFGRHVARGAIIEIGNLASTNAMAMIGLWGAAANDLGARGEVVVATLTRSLRAMFRRIGIVIHDLGPVDPSRLGDASAAWGSYYAQDPHVCAGDIRQGQAAIAAFLGRRTTKVAA